MSYKIIANDLGKKFSHGYIFKELRFEIESGQKLAIAGRNGSGKTTLLKIIAGLVYPDKGSVAIYKDGSKLSFPYVGIIGFVGPYLELYDQLTALENLQFYASQLKINHTEESLIQILDKVGLKKRYFDYVAGFSSGMKQRMKYAVLHLKNFPIYMLDEPTSNFDDAGRQLFYEFVSEHNESIIIIASNIQEETNLGDQIIELS